MRNLLHVGAGLGTVLGAIGVYIGGIVILLGGETWLMFGSAGVLVGSRMFSQMLSIPAKGKSP